MNAARAKKIELESSNLIRWIRARRWCQLTERFVQNMGITSSFSRRRWKNVRTWKQSPKKKWTNAREKSGGTSIELLILPIPAIASHGIREKWAKNEKMKNETQKTYWYLRFANPRLNVHTHIYIVIFPTFHFIVYDFVFVVAIFHLLHVSLSTSCERCT